MLISNPDTKKIVHDYDIVSVHGMMLPITIDLEAGDTVEHTSETIKFYLSKKPSIHDPSKILPAEDITVMKIHVFSVQHREREVLELTPEQKFEWSKTVQELSSSIQ